MFLSGAIITILGIAAIWQDVMSAPMDSTSRVSVVLTAERLAK